jgi:uncharacterized protein (DUF697 family)
MTKRSKLGMMGNVRSFVNVVREVNLDEIRAKAELAPRILVTAPNVEDAEKIAALIAGDSGSPYVSTARLDALPRTGHGFDAVIVYDPTAGGDQSRVVETLRAKELDIPVVVYGASDTSDEAEAERVREEIASSSPDRAPSYGRHIPSFRPAAVKAVINETARANAEFALISNIPSIIPIVGSLMAVGTDMLVLTKNQVLMIYKIAAIHDRDLHDQMRILSELVPVVGAGFFWRTLAREAAAFLPLLIGTLPKVGIAYIGTAVAGRAADYYYRYGKKPTKEQMQAIYGQAVDSLKRMPDVIPGRSSRNAKEESSTSDG